MSVAPDLLLKSAPEIKPKAAASKAPAKPAEPRNSEVSSFAQVYAKERQAQNPGRAEATGKPEHAAKAKPDDSENPVQIDPAAAAEQPMLAESGKPLPTEFSLDDLLIDPATLLGVAEQPATQIEVDAVDGEAPAEAQVLPSASLIGSGPAQMTAASFDPELDALNQIPAVHMALDLDNQRQPAVAQPSANANANAASQTTLNVGHGFANAMAAMGAQQAEGEPTELGDAPQMEISLEGLEALKESSADSRPENFVSKLSPLSQAIGLQAARTGLVPGQPVAMQQGGWSEAVVDRVMWLSSQNLKSAEIQLDPAELGRLEVRINMAQDQTQVTFASPHAGVREALEGQMHRLRELFAQQGMNLLDVNVSDQSMQRGWQGQDNSGRGEGSGNGQAHQGGGDDDFSAGVVAESVSQGLGQARGLVDYYA